MKNYVKISSIFFLLFIPFFLYSLDFSDFSENKKIFLKNIVISGQKLIPEQEILNIMKLKKEKGFFIYEISQAISNLISSGFFNDIIYDIKPLEEDYLLEVILKENPPLASLKVIDSKMLDLSVFKNRLNKMNVVNGVPLSIPALEKAIDEFNIYNQQYGTFLYIVSYRAVTKEEILEEGGKFLYTPDEIKQEGTHIIIYIKEIPRMYIKSIQMMDTTISYDEILSFLDLKTGMWIKNDQELYYRYKRLKKLGFYESVYFKIVPDDIFHKLIIYAKEIPLSEITTTLTSPTNIGIITSVEYYNMGLLKTLQRFRIGAGWQLNLSAPVFVLEYTHPYFWEGLFIDVSFSKTDKADAIKGTDNLKLTNNYDIKITTGINVYRSIFAYLFYKERYAISYTVDKKYQRMNEYERTKGIFHSSGLILLYDDLDDNFFITQGIKVFTDYEIFWQKYIAHKTGLSAEIYIPVPLFNLIAAVNNRTNLLYTDKQDKETTLSLDQKMRTNVQEIAQITEQQIKFTTYSSAELRFPLPEIENIVKDLSFIVFVEAGAAWANYTVVNLEQIKYGFGLGLRLSPRKHYSSFLFQFPAGLYIGYRTGDKKPSSPTFISHRDDLYYINLTASF